MRLCNRYVTLATLIALALGIVAGLIPALTAAQSPESDCSQRAAKLRAPLDGPEFTSAVRGVIRCPAEAVPLLSQAWRTPGRDSQEVAALRSTTHAIRDARLATTLLSVFKDPARDENVRMAAMLLLAPYYGDCLAVKLVTRDYGEEAFRVAVLLGAYYDDPTRPGPAAPSPSLPATILAALNEVGSREPDGLVGKAALSFAKRLMIAGPSVG